MERGAKPISEDVIDYIDLFDDDEELPYPSSNVGQDNRTISNNNAVKINLCEDILSKDLLACTTAITETIAKSNSTSNVDKKNATKKSTKRQSNNLEGPPEKRKMKCANANYSTTIEKLCDVKNIVKKNQNEQNNEERFKFVEENGLEKHKKILRSCNTTMSLVSDTKIRHSTIKTLAKNNNCGNVINVERDYDVNSCNTSNIIPGVHNNLDNQQIKTQISNTSITDAYDVTLPPIFNQLTLTPSKINKRVSFDTIEILLYNPNKTPDMLKVKAKYQHEKINMADKTSENSNIATRKGSPILEKEKIEENVPAIPANNAMRQLLQKSLKPPKASKMAKFLTSIQNENDYMISANNSDKPTAYTNIVTTKHINSEQQESENEINNQNMTLSLPSLLPGCSKEAYQQQHDIHSTTSNISNKTELSSKTTQKQKPNTEHINTLNSTKTPELVTMPLPIDLTLTKLPKSADSIENSALDQSKTQQPRQVPIKNKNNCNISKQLSTPLHRDMSADCSTKNNQNTAKAIPLSNSGPIPQASYFSQPLSSANHYKPTGSNYMGKEINNDKYHFNFSQSSQTRTGIIPYHYTNTSKLSNNPNIPVYPNPHLSSLQKQVYIVEQTSRNQCSADVGRPKPNECLDFRVRTHTSNELYDLITNFVSLENQDYNNGYQHRSESKSVETYSIKSMIDFLHYQTIKLLLEKQGPTKESSY